jgi:hypothetical protein
VNNTSSVVHCVERSLASGNAKNVFRQYFGHLSVATFSDTCNVRRGHYFWVTQERVVRRERLRVEDVNPQSPHSACLQPTPHRRIVQQATLSKQINCWLAIHKLLKVMAYPGDIDNQ